MKIISQISVAAIFILILLTFKVPGPHLAANPFLSLTERREEGKVFAIDNMEAKSAYVFDVLQNKVLYEKNSSEVFPLASLAKLMTVLLLEEKAPSGVFISVSEKAVELGMLSLNFLNPTGLDIVTASARLSGASGNAKDIASLLKYIYGKYPNILSRTREEEISIVSSAGKTITAVNTNEALGEIPQIIAGKTGYTLVAGGNFVFIFDAGFNHPIVVSILGSSEKGRFDDAKKIVGAVFKYYAK